MDSLEQQIDLVTIDCPYCGAAVDIALESDVVGAMVVDCEVCCRPWSLTTERDESGRRVQVERDE